MAGDPQAWSLGSGDWPAESVRTIRLDLPGGRAAAAAARHGIVDRLADLLTEEEGQDLQLVLSELVTNSFRHGGMSDGEMITVHAAVARDRLRVEVWDAGPGFEQTPPRPRSLAEGGGGLGLVLLDRLASAWGVTVEDQVCVWAEFER